ncbi:MAG TPA: type VI secretion system tube protein Hcp [Terriglobia bacterium]
MNVLILDCGDAVDGACQLQGYKNKIEVTSYSHGIAQPITGDPGQPRRTAGKPHHQDLTVTKHVDLASCALTAHCNAATVIPSLKLLVGEFDGETVNPFLTYQLSNALVSSISVGGGTEGKPQETVTFNYTKIQWEYKSDEIVGPVAGNGPQPKYDPLSTTAAVAQPVVPDDGKRQAKWSLEANRPE